MISYIVYLLGLITLILHFTGYLARRNLQWIVLVAPVANFGCQHSRLPGHHLSGLIKQVSVLAS